MKNVLILNGQYAPGYRGGGPIQSCINMVEKLYIYYNFYVMCDDHDAGSSEVYAEIRPQCWNRVGNANVYYLSFEEKKIYNLEKLLDNIQFEVLYLNGFFSWNYTIKILLLNKLKKIRNCKIILAPRGDFTGGCENKKIKKYTYIYLAKILKLYDNIEWHATSELEKNDIMTKFPKASISIAPNLSSNYVETPLKIKKSIGDLKLVFISRIFPKKNIKKALELLNKIKYGKITYDIYGPMEDESYWSECKSLINKLPSNITVEYKGELAHKEISSTFSNYHAFLFPTLGENYGHVIVEAMTNNCLCILSRNVTPWDEYCDILDLGADLDNDAKFIEIIERLLDMRQNEIIQLVKKNNDFIKNKLMESDIIMNFRKMIEG